MALLPLLIVLGAIRDAANRAWFEGQFRRATSVQPDMTRAQIERLYEPDGATQPVPIVNYVYRDAPRFLLHVEWRSPRPIRPGGPWQGDPNDRVATVGPVRLGQKAGEPYHPDPRDTHRAWLDRHVGRALSPCPGMARHDFDRLYTPDGGIQPILPNRFVYRDLPYFTVEATFRPDSRLARIGPVVLSRMHTD